ncbi:hypothetical protein CK203_002822 [Vitis vinifera]|uniref:Transcription termination factor MTERF15, mitochondrial n=1 Tax=Vitis vinifera TaxID=29760 RepID=A0A438KHN2_VITVI|nr:hypothetical protein CK203_002822 [Vitis vinifera]
MESYLAAADSLIFGCLGDCSSAIDTYRGGLIKFRSFTIFNSDLSVRPNNNLSRCLTQVGCPHKVLYLHQGSYSLKPQKEQTPSSHSLEIMDALIPISPNCFSGPDIAVIQNREKFSTSVKKVIEMGFDPLKVSFLKAVQVICGMGESIWEQRMEVYKRWGLTDDEIMSMFRLDPLCMRSSEKKIMSVMDFLVNKMGWEPATIARYPTVFMRSLEKKIIPRCSVVKVLQMKGLVKKDLCLGKIGILELGFVSEEIWEKKEL